MELAPICSKLPWPPPKQLAIGSELARSRAPPLISLTPEPAWICRLTAGPAPPYPVLAAADHGRSRVIAYRNRTVRRHLPALRRRRLHFAVPMAGAVINTGLAATSVAAIQTHAAPKLLFADYQCICVATDALKSIAMDAALLLVVVIDIHHQGS